MRRSGYVGIFSPAGKLVAYSNDRDLFKEVAFKVGEALPRKAVDKASGYLLDARRKAIQTLLDDDDD